MKFNHLADYDLLIRVKQIRICIEKELFKGTVIGIFPILIIGINTLYAMVIPGLPSNHNSHAAIFLLRFYSFDSYLCVVF